MALSEPVNPGMLPKACSILKCSEPTNPSTSEQTFYMVGTAHVSTASCDDVRETIRLVRPEVVMLELCDERKQILTMDKADVLSPSQLFHEWYRGRAPLLAVLYSWGLSQVGASLDVLPGEEFRVAVQEARKVNALVTLGDRPLSFTLARSWAALGLWEKARLVWTLLHMGLSGVPEKEMKDLLESLKESDVMTEAIKEFGETFPGLLRPLLEERDEFMVFILHRLATRASRVVAVVGAGHMPGIRAKWDRKIDIEEITRMPTPRARSGWPWGRIAIVTAGGVLATTLFLRWRRR